MIVFILWFWFFAISGSLFWIFQPITHFDNAFNVNHTHLFKHEITNGKDLINRESAKRDSGLKTKESGGRPDVRDIKSVRERLTYEVRYGFLRLGNVDVYIHEDTRYRDTPALHLVTEMVSNRRLLLIGYKEMHYHTYMAYNDSIPYGLLFWQDNIHRGRKETYKYDFDYPKGLVYSFEEGEPIDTLALNQPADGGPAILYYARLFAGTNEKRRYPIYIDHEKSYVNMHFFDKKEEYKSPAFPDKKVLAYSMDGSVEFDGPFGLSGDFKAYFKDDDLRIPLEARVSIWIGSVRVRLVNYERLN